MTYPTRARAAIAALALMLPVSLPAADYFREPPLPEVYTQILGRGPVARNVEEIYETMRRVEVVRGKDYAFVRRVLTAVTILVATGRRVDAEFVLDRLIAAIHKGRPRNLFNLAHCYNIHGTIRFLIGQRVRGEEIMDLATGYTNRVQGKRLLQLARDAELLAGILLSMDRPFLGQVMRDQAKAVRDTIRRRHGGARKVRKYHAREHQVPAMTYRSMKDYLIDVDKAKALLDETPDILSRARALAGAPEVGLREWRRLEAEVIPFVQKLSIRREEMKWFLFQLRRSSDPDVADIREVNIEDWRQLRRDLRLQAEAIISQLLIVRMKNSF
jgi:hypothetical protein